MKWLGSAIIFLITTGIMTETQPEAIEQTAKQPEAAKQPVVEVAFVLDTTGSMGGLIEGAKKKIWYIANQIILGEPQPDVRMALVAYRDKGDTYVTKVFQLTDNIDQVYKDLMSFGADGGGDTPENVNQGLHDAVHKLDWSKDPDTLRVIYLVGDCPPHNEYTDVPTYDKIARSAIQKDIYINTILCGNHAQAREVWMDIARRSEGTFLAISQDGGVKNIDTPFDKELARLNTEMTGTVVAYGSSESRKKAGLLNCAVAEMECKAPAAAAADRATFAATSGRYGSDDLVQAIVGKKVKLEDIPKKHLPENMQKMSEESRKKYIAGMQKKREEVTARIKKLSSKRADFIRKEIEKTDGAKDGFDAQVVETLKAQAAKKKISYK